MIHFHSNIPSGLQGVTNAETLEIQHEIDMSAKRVSIINQ
jgi:hypothetical protein